MLVSFIKSAGLKLLLPALQKFTDRGGRLRIITTTYLGASDPAAIQRLGELPNTEIESGFPHLPSGCHIHFERQAREIILQNIRQSYRKPDLRIKEAFLEWSGAPPPPFPSSSPKPEKTPSTYFPQSFITKRDWPPVCEPPACILGYFRPS